MKKNALSLSALALATALYGHTAQAELPRDFQEFKVRYQQEGLCAGRGTQALF